MTVIVNIPDDKFRACLCAYLGQPSWEPITDDELATLTGAISVSEQGIADITGAEYLINIDMFDASYNQLVDISPIAGLVKLTDLRFTGNHISTLSPLSQLVNLTYFEAGNNSISQGLDAFSNLTKLNSLDLRQNYIKDISVLSPLINLTYLSVNSNQLKDFSVCRNFSHLKGLEIDVNQLWDFTPLASLPELTDLTLTGQKIHPAAVPNNGSAQADDPVINVDGSIIPPATISDGGSYENGVITWPDLSPDLTQVTYTISQIITAGSAEGTLDATVYQALTVS